MNAIFGIPIKLDLLVALALLIIFVLPLFLHFTWDLRSRRGRNFSIIPNKLRHFIINLIRIGLIYIFMVLGIESGSEDNLIMWIGLTIFFLLVSVLGVTDRRLTINATTGVVKWKKITLPWWPSKITFIDRVSQINNGWKMDVLGIGMLERFSENSVNENTTHEGHTQKNASLVRPRNKRIYSGISTP